MAICMAASDTSNQKGTKGSVADTLKQDGARSKLPSIDVEVFGTVLGASKSSTDVFSPMMSNMQYRQPVAKGLSVETMFRVHSFWEHYDNRWQGFDSGNLIFRAFVDWEKPLDSGKKFVVRLGKQDFPLGEGGTVTMFLPTPYFVSQYEFGALGVRADIGDFVPGVDNVELALLESAEGGFYSARTGFDADWSPKGGAAVFVLVNKKIKESVDFGGSFLHKPNQHLASARARGYSWESRGEQLAERRFKLHGSLQMRELLRIFSEVVYQENAPSYVLKGSQWGGMLGFALTPHKKVFLGGEATFFDQAYKAQALSLRFMPQPHFLLMGEMHYLSFSESNIRASLARNPRAPFQNDVRFSLSVGLRLGSSWKKSFQGVFNRYLK